MTEKTVKEKRSFAEIFSKYGAIMILACCLIVGTVVAPNFMTPSNLLSIAKNVAVYAIIAIGMTRLLIGGGVDLSAGSNVALTAVVCALVCAKSGSTALAILAAVLVGGIVGVINGYFTAYIGLMPFIVTLATQMSVRGIAYLAAGGSPVYGVSNPIVWMGQGNLFGIPMLLIIVILAAAAFVFVQNRTSHGRYLYAIGGNAEAANAAGINVKFHLFINYVIMGAIAGLAGVLYAGRTNSGLPAGGVNFEFEAIIGSVLGGTSMAGGVGNIAMSIVGIYIVGIINNVMNLLSLNSFWQQVVKGIVILIAVLLDIFTRNAIMRSTSKRG